MPTSDICRRDAFKYTPAAETNVAATWRRFGFRPTRHQRRARQGGLDLPPPAELPSRRAPACAATGGKEVSNVSARRR